MLMKLMYKLFSISITLLLAVPIGISTNKIEISDEELNIVTINIAQYPRYAGCDETFDVIFHYVWESNNTIYKFNCTELTLEEVMGCGKRPLSNKNFDLLVVGASFDSFYRDAKDPKIQENIKEFLVNGGGYIGVCAGTVFATQGYKTPNRIYKKFMNQRVLKIADVYINCDLYGEAQYEFKLGGNIGINQGLLPIEKRVVRNNSIPVFLEYSSDVINITYGGGPGMYVANASDPNLGEITPLLIINEELMQTKPVHWFRKGLLPGWVPFKKVKTDIEGQYGAIATKYGEGRVVIFTSHPEIQLILNGTIKEYIGRSTGYGIKFPFPRAVFSWTGTPMNMSYNWWIHRRTAAWIAGVSDEDLPPCNELMAFVDKPQFRFGFHEFYFEGEGLIYGYGDEEYYNNSSSISKPSYETAKQIVDWVGMTVVAGNITVDGYAENSDRMEFYVDNVLQYTDTKQPFEWTLNNGNLSGFHTLEVRSYDEYDNYAFDGSEFFFINI